MKNKQIIYLILLFISLFILNMNFCHAEIYKGKIIGSGVNFRSGPGTNYESLKTVSKDSEYNLVNNTIHLSEEGCSNGWYKFYYEGSATGYICSDYVSVTTLEFDETPTNECEQSLSDLGFPPSYWSSLCTLKESHPNWQFKPLYTNLDWSEAVDNESACGISYIQSNISTNIDPTCKNEYTKTWYPASSTAVAYYMDPRNWLTEQYIFQFEYLTYDNTIADLYTSAITNTIAHTEFYKYHLGLGNDLGQIIDIVGKENNISPVFISSRILQEMGSTNKLYNLYSGAYAEEDGKYLGYYNFYNFGVKDSCATLYGVTKCGLDYAMANNWFGLQNALMGGVSQIANNYSAKGQYTIYLQKYNVTPTDSSKLYTHQYMTNIAAPSSEAKSAYNTYKKLGILDNLYVFYIPIYNNMDDTNYKETQGAVDSKEEENVITMDISTIITSSGYKYIGEYITGINLNTNVADVKSAIESISGSNTVKITNKDDVLVNDGLIGTGFQITVNNSLESKTLQVVINGDTSGDGLANPVDLLQIQKNILGTYTLDGVYFMAGDTSDDGAINPVDLLQVQKSILGTYTIVQ